MPGAPPQGRIGYVVYQSTWVFTGNVWSLGREVRRFLYFRQRNYFFCSGSHPVQALTAPHCPLRFVPVALRRGKLRGMGVSVGHRLGRFFGERAIKPRRGARPSAPSTFRPMFLKASPAPSRVAGRNRGSLRRSRPYLRKLTIGEAVVHSTGKSPGARPRRQATRRKLEGKSAMSQ